jgi:hypothetical protein
MTRHQRDLIRRRVLLLLNALGDTPEAIGATLHRLDSLGEPQQAPEWCTPLDAHVQLRLGRTVAVEPLLTTVDDTFAVATPTAIGHYLRNTASSPR